MSSFGDKIRRKLAQAQQLAETLSQHVTGADGLDNSGPQDEPIVRTTRVPEGELVYAIGDIHGRFDLLTDLLEMIDADRFGHPEDLNATIVFLGDYIDRGLQSRQVIDLFLSNRLENYNAVFVMGNHEEALLEFLKEPSFGEQWSRYGGRETLYSYGLQPPPSRGSDSYQAVERSRNDWLTLWNAFQTKLPPEHLEFYKSLTPQHIIGDYIFVHAGLRPGAPLNMQSPKDMMWIREEFLAATNLFPKLVVHGHTPEDFIHRDNRRLGLDTGAYLTGRLSAARFLGEDIAFLSTG